jgi:hypothetical protein
MRLNNTTRMAAAYTLGVDPAGRESVVVAVKGTFSLPRNGERPQLMEEQRPLLMADTFTGEPGRSAPVFEADFAPRKPLCDVLLVGSAWAPGGKPAERVAVGLKIGQLKKVFAVVGDRVWTSSLSGVGIAATSPQPFVQKAISYDVAFGGLDDFHEDPGQHQAFMANPVGRGWHYHLEHKYLDGTPLPNTEELDRKVDKPNGSYVPMSFGPVGRGWSSRLPLAGTYDQNWIDNTFPFLPPDFRDEYYQAAPVTQQTSIPDGPIDVSLANLTKDGRVDFTIPAVEVPVIFFHREGGHREVRAALDTITFLPDQGVFTLVWRASVPLKRTILEVADIVVGKMTPAWWRARGLGKRYYPSLDSLAQTRAREAEETV